MEIYNVVPGNPAIYESPDVSHAQTPSGALEKSVHEDARGVIQRLNISTLPWLANTGQTLPNILYTRAGFKRSGDLHKNKQYDLVLPGKVELWTFQEGQTVKKIIEPQTLIILGENVPHLFNFLEDTIMLEWWSGAFEAWYFKPYRDIINSST